MKKSAILLVIGVMLLLASCADNREKVSDADFSSSAASTVSEETTNTPAEEETNTDPDATSTADSEPESSGSASPPSKDNTSKATGGDTQTPTSKAPDTPKNDPPATSQPTTQPPVASKPTEPSAKSIYDRPYDIAAIEQDMASYVKSKGGSYDGSMNLDNCGMWVDPLPTNAKWQGDKLKNTLRDDIDDRIGMDRYSSFRVYFKPISGGEYEIIVLCG